MATYSEETDLQVGPIPLPPYLDKAKVLADTADEIDSNIGFIYKTPINMTDNGPVARPARLLLKRISSHISTGRLILALASGGEDDSTHAYGRMMLKQGQDALRQIANGTIDLDGAEKVDGEAASPTGPMIANVDARSLVEGFYGDAMSGTPYFGTRRRAGG